MPDSAGAHAGALDAGVSTEENPDMDFLRSVADYERREADAAHEAAARMVEKVAKYDGLAASARLDLAEAENQAEAAEQRASDAAAKRGGLTDGVE